MIGRAARWAGALALAVAALVPAAPVAAAGGDGSALVVLGDSFAANGFRWEADAKECLRGETSWPNQLSRLTGTANTPDFVDRSCSGAAIESDRGYSLVRETLDADRAGGFGPRTRMVAIQFGLNDDWGTEHPATLWTSLIPCVFNLADGCDRDAAAAGRITDFRAVTGPAYAARIADVVRYLRYYAPNARIVLVGYPELFPPGQDAVCLNILGAGAFVQPRGGGLIEYLDRIDAAQRAAAEQLGIDFLDTRALTAEHGLCSAEPWLNGVLDPRADPVGLPFHPSAHGDAVLASALHERYGR
ncbi:SGNH/GDSL hydrolase family protein [Nocardia asteroides]|uniref:SGNH/GDSL hydrolase family protein n=1 Tax=Nocardia asteroides TaxID=1824 RepID=UPI001E346023|nr:SGNH/GDSL hydrolase family protein [Nocardia asteroides]UGT63112.1 SGNH/GDSL hydrolase family protein [Nocardia asteroides]